MYDAYSINTLQLNQDICIGCRMCLQVCPHAVFEITDRKAVMVHPERCMECGACAANCEPGAITVDSGVGCAAAMIFAALTGKEEPECGCGQGSACC